MKKNTIILLILAVLLCLPTLVNCEWIRVATFLHGHFVPGGQVDAWFDGNEWADTQHYSQTQSVYDFEAPHSNEGVGVNARVTHNNSYFFDWIEYDPDNLPPHLFVDVYNL
ncbi:MAG: hypothetical protein K8R68_08955 [Bacteroidales bacterium]|nr:hypothetical protein [Bacteroidales bacterium]